ncbi:MAG: polysaccharide deacetylase family protein [Lysinibacillus sp.]
MTQVRRKRRPLIDLVLIGIIVSLTTVILFIVLSKDTFKFQKTNAESTKNISTESSTFPGIRIVTDVANDKQTPLAIHYPQTESSAFNEEVLQYINTSKENYLNTMKKKKNENGELNISLETYSHRKQYYSFILTKSEYTGGANHNVSTKTFFFNSKSGKQVDMRTLLQNDENNLTTLAAHVRSELKQNPKLKDTLLEEQLLKSTEPKWANFERFALTDDSLILYFDEYEIASGAAGSPTVELSLSFINPILAADFQIAMEEMGNTIVTEQKKANDPNTKRIALTFDDGPHPTVTEQVLNTLQKYNAKATFFMLGNRVQYYPNIAKDVLTRGHEIGNHSWSHPVLTKLPNEQIVKEYSTTANALKNAIGQDATVFRPPYGATNKLVNAQIPIPVVMWSIDTMDWKYRNAQQLLPHIQNSLHNNAIVLMHDIHQSTADGLDAVLSYLQGQGYEFVTVSEIMQYR